jgi:hypothetical protein
MPNFMMRLGGGGPVFLQNVGNHLPDCMASHLSRPQSKGTQDISENGPWQYCALSDGSSVSEVSCLVLNIRGSIRDNILAVTSTTAVEYCTRSISCRGKGGQNVKLTSELFMARPLRRYGLQTFQFHIVVFSIMTPCSLIGGYQCFRALYCPHIQSETLVSPYQTTR